MGGSARSESLRLLARPVFLGPASRRKLSVREFSRGGRTIPGLHDHCTTKAIISYARSSTPGGDDPESFRMSIGEHLEELRLAAHAWG